MGIFPGKRKRHNAYCAFCRTPRRIFRKRNVSFVNFIGAMLTSPILMWLMWGGPDARVFVIFACLLGLNEALVQLRWRMSVVCRACGFDPVLYLKAPSLAAERVKARLDQRKSSSESIMGPRLNLPTLSSERSLELSRLEEMKKAPPGRLMSRDV